MMMFNLTYPPWPSRTENNLNIFMAGFSESNKKIMLAGEIFSPTRLIFQYIKEFFKE